MQEIFTSSKSVEDTLKSLEESIAKNGFGVLHIHNLKEKLNAKGVEYSEESMVLDICNPKIAKEILTIDPALSSILPCKISLYEQSGTTKIAMLKPTFLLPTLNEKLKDIASGVEEKLILAIKDSI